MTSVTINRDEYDEDNAPLTAEGDDYPYIMVGADKIIFSEGFGDLTAALFDDVDYLDLDPTAQLEHRHGLAVAVATSAQGGVVSHLTESGTLDLDSLDETQINLIFNSKENSYESDGDWSATDSAGATIPLFLVSTMYAPFTEIEKITGEDVTYLDPTDEEKFIRSLAGVGIVELYEVAG